MNSYNFIHNIYKSYSVGPALEARIANSFDSNKKDNTSMEIESEQHSNLTNVLILYKQNTIELWRQNSISKGFLENIAEVQVYCNILKVAVIKSSDSQKSDIIFIISDDLQYRFFRVNIKGEVQVIEQGVVQNLDQEKISDVSQVFVSQLKINKQESNCIIGIYAYYKNINLIVCKEFEGEIKLVTQSQVKKQAIMEKIYNIVAVEQKQNQNQHLIGVYYSYQRESKFAYSQLEIEQIDSDQYKLSASKRHCLVHETESQQIYALQLFTQQGLIFFSDYKIFYQSYNDKSTVEFTTPFPEEVICHSHVKDTTYFIATQDAAFQSSLYLVNILVSSRSIDIKLLGRISPPTSIIQLPEQHIFITSIEDDCKVIKVHDKFIKNLESHLEVKLKLSNLSSIYNMKLLESDFNQRLIISSPRKEQSMNIFQKGMSLIQKGEIKFNSPIREMLVVHKIFIVVSFDFQTLILKLDEQKGSFNVIMNVNCGLLNVFALESGSESQKLICLVSAQSIKLIDLTRSNVLSEITISDKRIILSTINKNILITADSTNNLQAFNFLNNQINQVETFSYSSRYSFSAINSYGNYIAIALWFQPYIILINASDPTKTHHVDIPAQKVVRSLIFHEENKLLIGYSDGIISLVYYSTDDQNNVVTSSNQKNMVIGYKPVKFRQLQLFSSYCQSSTPVCISCISNEVSILSLRKVDESYQRYQKTYFNIQDVNQIDEIEINGVPYLVMAKKNCLSIGGIEVSQKFHIYSFGKDVKEQNEFRCQTELVDVIRNMSVSISIVENDQDYVICSNILLHSIKNQDLLQQIKFNNMCVYSLLVVGDYFFIGGKQEHNQAPEGFLQTYLVDNENKMIQVDKIAFKIPVMQIQKYGENSIAIILGHENFKIYQMPYTTAQEYSILKQNNQQKFLQEIVSQSNLNITALSMDCNSRNQILIADRTQGIQLFQEQNKKVMLAAKSPFPVFSTHAKFLGDENIVLSDSNTNIVIFRQNDFAENDFERMKLLVLSAINNGDIVITSLRRKVSTKDVKDKYITTEGLDQVIYGTQKGWIGVIMSLNEQAYTVLQDLQESILQRFKCPLKFDYNKWKSIKNIPQSKSDKSNFIDGEIIFKVLKMSQQELVQVLDGMSAMPKPSIAEMEQLIENLDLLIF
ncbi:hypothetical protein ABPG74_013106 [Tetrahymena malaccensis]